MRGLSGDVPLDPPPRDLPLRVPDASIAYMESIFPNGETVDETSVWSLALVKLPRERDALLAPDDEGSESRGSALSAASLSNSALSCTRDIEEMMETFISQNKCDYDLFRRVLFTRTKTNIHPHLHSILHIYHT